MVPMPDFSMPFNVLALASTAITLYFGGIFREMGSKRKPHWSVLKAGETKEATRSQRAARMFTAECAPALQRRLRTEDAPGMVVPGGFVGIAAVVASLPICALGAMVWLRNEAPHVLRLVQAGGAVAIAVGEIARHRGLRLAVNQYESMVVRGSGIIAGLTSALGVVFALFGQSGAINACVPSIAAGISSAAVVFAELAGYPSLVLSLFFVAQMVCCASGIALPAAPVVAANARHFVHGLTELDDCVLTACCVPALFGFTSLLKVLAGRHRQLLFVVAFHFLAAFLLATSSLPGGSAPLLVASCIALLIADAGLRAVVVMAADSGSNVSIYASGPTWLVAFVASFATEGSFVRAEILPLVPIDIHDQYVVHLGAVLRAPGHKWLPGEIDNTLKQMYPGCRFEPVAHWLLASAMIWQAHALYALGRESISRGRLFVMLRDIE